MGVWSKFPNHLQARFMFGVALFFNVALFKILCIRTKCNEIFMLNYIQLYRYTIPSKKVQIQRFSSSNNAKKKWESCKSDTVTATTILVQHVTQTYIYIVFARIYNNVGGELNTFYYYYYTQFLVWKSGVHLDFWLCT